MRTIIWSAVFICVLTLPIFLGIRKNNFIINQLGKPLEEVVSNFKTHKNLKPFCTGKSSIEYKNVPFGERTAFSMNLYSFNGLLYETEYKFIPKESGTLAGTNLFTEMMTELSELYGKDNLVISDPDEKYNFKIDYLNIVHWYLGDNIIILSQINNSNIVSLQYRHIDLFNARMRKK